MFDNVRHGSVNKVTFKVVVDTNEPMIIRNTAKVTVGERDPKITNETHGGVEAKNSADLTPDDGLLPSDTLSYSVNYVNFDPATASLTITDTLPAHTTYAEGSAKLNGTAVTITPDDNGKFSLEIPDVGSGKGGRLTFDVTIDADAISLDPLENSATVTIGPNSETTNKTIDIVNGKDSDDEDEICLPGQEITYTIVYANEALEPADITITDISGMITWPDNMNTSAWFYYAVQEATNRHDFTRQSDNVKRWASLIKVPDWEAHEKSWSTANSVQ